jgi:hypothetical protein
MAFMCPAHLIANCSSALITPAAAAAKLGLHWFIALCYAQEKLKKPIVTGSHCKAGEVALHCPGYKL